MSGAGGEQGRREAGFAIDGVRLPAPRLAPGLYVVATPIGNLKDITLRALMTFAAADLVACEDTRVTGFLLSHYGISTALIAYHDHNAPRQRPKILAALAEGKAVALSSDAGTPLVSDPGFRLVAAAIADGHPVIPIPGACALLAGLVASGLPTDAFLFAGFLPPKEVARRKRLQALSHEQATLVFYEAPQRLAAALADMAAVLGPARPAAVARELTKAFEEVRRDTLGTLAERYAGEAQPKGELVVVVGPPAEAEATAEDIDGLLRELLASNPVSAAAEKAAALTGVAKRELYRRALELRAGDGEVE